MCCPDLMGRRILAIEAGRDGGGLSRASFAADGFDLTSTSDGTSGLARAAAERPDLVLLELDLPDGHGTEILEKLKLAAPDLPVIVLTGPADVQRAVQATQLGAADYLVKPVEPGELRLVVRRVLESSAIKREIEELRRRVGETSVLAAQMGPGEQTRDVVNRVRTVAASSLTVLLVGETGTGKELVAQAIHRKSPRRGKPLIALDCGAIPEQLFESELFGHEKGAFTGAAQRRTGRFQLAEGGTLFLDEVGNLPSSLQAKLLRVLESRQVHPLGGEKAAPLDVRFVAATNQSLQQRVAQGLFRADLYFRLAQYTICLSPLRERVADIPYLAQRFLDEARVELRRPLQDLGPDVLALLQHHHWPGNVRELRNVMRQAVLEATDLAVGPEIIERLLGSPGTPPAVSLSRPSPSPPRPAERSLKQIADDAAAAAERLAICDALRFTRGNKSQAARALKTDYKTLHVKMKRLGVRARDFEG